MSDKLRGIAGGAKPHIATHYLAEVVSASDYYPFGWEMPGRKVAGDYRYGFNGKEKDDEMKGERNSYDFGARLYDSRIGRWLSVDPLAAKFISWSDYNFATNNPIQIMDPNGRDTLLMHVNRIASPNGNKTLLFKVTFSVIQDGIEKGLDLKPVDWEGKPIGDRVGARMYLAIDYGMSGWKPGASNSGNKWYKEGKEETFSIAFESYRGLTTGKEYPNSIKLKQFKSNSSRVMIHYLSSSGSGVGCVAPACEIGGDETSFSLNTNYGQEALDAINKLFEEYIDYETQPASPPNRVTNVSGYKSYVKKPSDGNDFQLRTNSTAPNSPQREKEQKWLNAYGEQQLIEP